MQFKYGLDDKVPLGENWLLGLQWLFIAIPSILIIGKIVGGLHYTSPLDQVVYLQKLSLVMALTIFFQVLWGHRLPLISGPSTVLLIGVIASRSFAVESVYTSMMIGGLILALLSTTGLFGHLRKLFTTRVVAVVLLLIGFTLMPTVMNLITRTSGRSSAWANLFFAFGLTLGLIVLQKYLKGIWKSTLILWAMFLGSLGYFLIFHEEWTVGNLSGLAPFSFFGQHLFTGFSFEPGVLISFLICFLALSINDLGSIESMEEILNPSQMPQRINRGITFTGMANVLAGFFGVVGPVNFSLSPGVILSTRCASRYTLIPTAVLLFLLSFSPAATGLIGIVPSVIIGTVLLYILCFQVGAGIVLVSKTEGGSQVETGLVIGLPLLLGTMVAFLPSGVIETFPMFLRPLLGNGFVIGIFTAFLLEGIIFRKRERGTARGKE
ncbi:MAG: purine/pyrimidine permease [Deltaproteobacteria bacterium]|nr:purine/pyrimidine permease [Deltaproteobacteria bacterium]